MPSTVTLSFLLCADLLLFLKSPYGSQYFHLYYPTKKAKNNLFKEEIL